MKDLTVFEELMKHCKVEDPTVTFNQVITDLHENISVCTTRMKEATEPDEWCFSASQWWSAQILLFSYRWHQ